MKYNQKTAAAVMNSLLRAARKMHRESLHDVWTDEQGRTCASDGYRAYVLNAAPAGLKSTLANRPNPARAAENNKIWHAYSALWTPGKRLRCPPRMRTP